VVVTVNETNGNGAKAEHIQRIRALIADADSAEQGASLRRFIASTSLVPSVLVESGGLAIGPDGTLVAKLPAYWRMDDCPLQRQGTSTPCLPHNSMVRVSKCSHSPDCKY
jgi:hypothetical protein